MRTSVGVEGETDKPLGVGSCSPQSSSELSGDEVCGKNLKQAFGGDIPSASKAEKSPPP